MKSQKFGNLKNRIDKTSILYYDKATEIIEKSVDEDSKRRGKHTASREGVSRQ